MFSQRAYTWPSFDHRVCIAVCTCTPRLSSTLYTLLELYLSVFLVVILTHPQLLHRGCRGSVPCRVLSVWSRGMWRVFVVWTCVCTCSWLQ